MLGVVGKHVMHKLKSNGEIFEPLGIPAVMFFVSDLELFMRTAKQKSERKNLITYKLHMEYLMF